MWNGQCCVCIHVEWVWGCLFVLCVTESCRAQAVLVPEALVDIVLTAVQLSSSLCGSSHLSVLLGAYRATLSTAGECQPGQGTSFCISFLPPQVTNFGFNLGF